MLGKIISIDGYLLKIELTIDVTNKTGLSNLHVAIECQGKKIIGEIISLDLTTATIMLLGEIINNELLTLRDYYNANITNYNKMIKKVPTNIIAKIKKYKERPFYDLKDMTDEDYQDFKL